jgi:K+-transporting ATPase ATPase C chain
MTNQDEPAIETEWSKRDEERASPGPQSGATLREQLHPALLSTVVLTLLTGAVFPLALAALACPIFPRQAGGSLLVQDCTIGSELIGQEFSGPGYFHSRPSAAGRGYDGAASGGSNLGPSNPRLRDGSPDDPTTRDVNESFVGVRELVEAYRVTNGLAPDAVVPADAVTRSASGLDPHISPPNAILQAPRVARSRGLSEATVLRLIAEHTEGRQFGLFGEPRVNVLALNLALDQLGTTGRIVVLR